MDALTATVALNQKYFIYPKNVCLFLFSVTTLLCFITIIVIKIIVTDLTPALRCKVKHIE